MYAIRKFIYDFLFDSYGQLKVLYLVPFSRYSTSKFLGFDLELWPLKVIWGSKKIYYLKAHIWLPIWLLWTPSLYLVPFSRYSTSKFLGFDLQLWPLKVILGSKNIYYSEAHIWLPIWLLWTPSLYLVPFSRYSTSKFSGFDLELWPLKVILGSKNIYYSEAHIRLPIWLLWTIYLYLVLFSRYSTSKFSGFDLDFWPLNVIWGRKILYYSKAHIWLPIWLLWTPSLYLVPFSRYSTSKFLGFDLDLRPIKVIWSQKIVCHSVVHIWLPIWLLWTTKGSLSRTVLEIFDFKVFRVWPWTLTLKGHLGFKKNILFESPYMTSYLTSMDAISLSRTVLEIFDFKFFRVWPRPLTPKSHLGSKIFILFGSSYMTTYLTSMDTISLSRTVLEIFDFKIFRVWPWTLTLKGHLGFKKYILFGSPYTTSYLTSMDDISLSRTVFEIFDFKIFRVWPWPLTLKCHLGSKNFILFESPYMTSYLTSMNTISLSRTVLEIFDFKVFRVWPWPSTIKGHLKSKNCMPFESSYMTSYLTPMDN